MKTITRSFAMALLSFFIIFSTSCHKDPVPDPETDWQKMMEELIVPNGFNYASTREATITVTMPFTVDYSVHRSRIDIFTAPASEGGLLLHTGSVNEQGVFTATLTVPVTYDSLFVQTEAGSAYVHLTTLKSGTSTLDGGLNFGNGYDTLPPMDTIAGTKSAVNQAFINGRYHSPGVVVDNLITNGTFDINDFVSFFDWISPMALNQKWYYTSSFQSAFSRYSDNGNYCARVKVPPGSLLRSGGIAQLIEASPGDLITFSTDFKHTSGNNPNNKVWLFIIPRNAAGNSINFYSYEIPSVDALSSWTTFTVSATMPSGTTTVQILLWQWIFSGYHFFDNVVVTGPVTDTDGDGVDDEQDEYPNDPARAYNIFYPSVSTFNTLAFEDNWPGKGDYDFNDLVVDYRYHQVTNAANALVDLNAKFVIRAIGASLTNGFGFQMDLPSNLINQVTGSSITESYITLGANGAEAVQTKGTVIVTDNVFTQLPRPGGGTGVNTEQGGIYVEADTMDFSLSFTQPVPLSVAGSPPYNPFLMVNLTRGREVHLPDQLPTDLADPGFFGTENDDSDPATGKYYKTINNLPWGIDIPYPFAYPVERSVILQAYLHFGQWAESGGVLYANWYLDEPGNRNNAYIYSHTP